MKEGWDIPKGVNWFLWILCWHRFCSDPLEFSKICVDCGWHNTPFLSRWSKFLHRLDRRGEVVGILSHSELETKGDKDGM